MNDELRDGLQLFSADGSFQRVVRWRPVEALLECPRGSKWTIRPGPRPGILYTQGPDVGFGSVFGVLAEADERMIGALDLASDVVAGEVLLEAWRPPRPERANAEIEPGNAASMMSFIGVPYHEPKLEWEVLPGGAIAHADSQTYTVRIVRDGVVLNTLTRAIALRSESSIA